MSTSQQALDAVMASTGSKATYTGAGVTVVGGLMLNEIAIIVGMFVGLLGLAVNWYYKHKLTMAEIRLKQEQAEREKAEHAARMGMYQ